MLAKLDILDAHWKRWRLRQQACSALGPAGISLYFAPSPTKRPRFGDGDMSYEDPRKTTRLWAALTLAPHGIGSLLAMGDVDVGGNTSCCAGGVDPGGWAVVGCESGRVACRE